MVNWELKFEKQAANDAKQLKSANLEKKAQKILSAIKEDPYITPPPFEKLRADLCGKYSRRINIKHRLVYSIEPENKIIKVYSMFSHYGE